MLALLAPLSGCDPLGSVVGSTEEQACQRLRVGEAQVRSASTMLSEHTPDIDALDVRFEVELPTTERGGMGWLYFLAPEAGDYLFAFDSHVVLTLDAGGPRIPLEPVSNVGACEQLGMAYTTSLPMGAYAVRLGPTQNRVISVVAEQF